MSSSTSPALKPGPLPFSLAGLLAVGGFFATTYGTGALGHGIDVHARRASPLVLALFLGGLGAFWPGRKLTARAVALLVGAGLGVAAWAYVPGRAGGPSLAGAAAKRDELRVKLTAPAFDDVGKAADLRREVDSLAGDFPSLAEGVRNDLRVWGEGAAAALRSRFEQLGPDDVTAARAESEKGRSLADALPERRKDSFEATQGWMRRAVRARSDELDKVASGDFDGFERTSQNRRRLAEAFPLAQVFMDTGEDNWATRTALAAIKSSADKSPKELRAACREADARLTALAGDPAKRFLSARQHLFAAAHEAARAEARSHIEAERYDRAFGVARTHAVEWAATAALLTDAEQKSVAELRETCRYLAALAEKAGDAPDTAPPPRSKP